MPKRKASGKRSPLWLHPSGQWCRKHKQEFHYFGTDREEAERRYREEWDGIINGKKPRRRGGSLALGDLCNRFLTAKRLRVDAGELSSRQWAEYHTTCDTLCSTFGRDTKVTDLFPEDFGRLRAKAAKRLGPPALAKFVQMVRTVFIFAYKSDLIEVPIKYGDQFDKPPRRVMRLERAKKDAKLIDAADVWKLLDKADTQMRAMIFLGLNAGYGQADCSSLQRKDLTARPGWLMSPRQKTGIAAGVRYGLRPSRHSTQSTASALPRSIRPTPIVCSSRPAAGGGCGSWMQAPKSPAIGMTRLDNNSRR